MGSSALLSHPSPGVPTPGSRGTALLVDDELFNRVILKALLRKNGFEVVEAADGAEAVDRFRDMHPDIVFMDVMMPVMDGYEATRRIKALCNGTFVPVVFLTAMTEGDALARCIDVGGDDFLTKPYSHTILTAKIRAMERIRDLHGEVSGLYKRMKRDEEIAQQVFDGAVCAGNVGLDAIRTRLQGAETFSGDVLLTAFTPLGDLHVLLGDFTGHGLAAALGALPASEVFRGMTAKGFSEAQILSAVSRKLHKLLPTGMFLATQFVTVHRDLHRISVSNCGMPEVLVLDGKSGGIRARVASTGLPLGISPSVGFDDSVRHISIQPGDRVLLASDGVTEAVNPAGELFGEARFEEAIAAAQERSAVLEDVNRTLDAFCQGAPQLDDISLVEIPCTPEVFAGMDSWQLHPAPTQAALESGAMEAVQEGWAFTLTLRGKRLKDVDPVPLIASQIQEVEGSVADRRPLFTVLTELYVNALDHGVLGLDSSLKHDAAGFERYFYERERRLAELADGYVRILIRVQSGAGGSRLVLRVEDSGPGFDLSKVADGAPASQQLCGRGIALVHGLCESVRYEPPGNAVEAVFACSKA